MARRPTKHKRTRTRRHRTRGAGYGFQFSGSSPGILNVQPYIGAGKDCATPVNFGSFQLPGLKGGSRRSRHRGGSYGFTAQSADLMASAPFERLGCRGMRGGANPAYFAATAGYSTQAEVVPGSAAGGFLRTVAYPDKAFTPACMNGGSRRKHRSRRHRSRRHRSRRNH